MQKVKYCYVPQWAGIFTIKDFNFLIKNIENNFNSSDYFLDVNEGTVEVPDLFGKKNYLRLSKLAETCKKKNKIEWPYIVRRHFENKLEEHKIEAKLIKVIKDFSQISQYITVRILPESYLETEKDDNIIYKKDIPDTITVLTFDLPSSIRNITKAEAKLWKKTYEELFDIGYKNIIENKVIEISEDYINGKECYLISGNHSFTSTFSLELDSCENCIGEFGSIVGIPNSNAIISYPINGKDVFGALNRLVLIVFGLYKDGAEPLSSSLYWYRDDVYTKLPYEIKGDSVYFYPPVEFNDLLNEIGE